MTKTVKWDVLLGKFDFRSVCKLVNYGAFCVLMPLEAFTICLFLTRRTADYPFSKSGAYTGNEELSILLKREHFISRSLISDVS